MKNCLQLFIYIAYLTSSIKSGGREKSKYLRFVKQNYGTFSKGFKILNEEYRNMTIKRSGQSFKGRNIEGAATFKSMQPEKNADLDAILKNVKADDVSGSSIGMLDVFGLNAFPILAGEAMYHDSIAAGAAAKFEKGKVVAFGHERFTQINTDQAESNTLFLNSINWASRKSKNEKKKTGVLKGEKSTWTDDIMKFLNDSGFDGQIITPNDLETQTELKLENTDILIFPSFYDVKTAAVERIINYVKNGGGFVSGYKFTDTDFVGNEILGKMGMIHMPDDDWLRVTISNVSKDLLIDAHSGWNAKVIIQLLKSNTSVENFKPRWKQISDVVSLSFKFANLSDLERLHEFKETIMHFFTSGLSIETTQWDRIWDLLKHIFNADLEWYERVKEAIVNVINSNTSIESDCWEQIWEIVKLIFELDSKKSNQIEDSIINLLKSDTPVESSHWNQIWDVVKLIFKSNTTGFDEIKETVNNLFKSDRVMTFAQWDQILDIVKLIFESDKEWLEQYTETIMQIFKSNKPKNDSTWEQIDDSLRYSLKYTNKSNVDWLDELVITNFKLSKTDEPLEGSRWDRTCKILKYSIEDVNMSELTWPETFKTETMKLIAEGKIILTNSEWNSVVEILQISLKYDPKSRTDWLTKFRDVVVSKSPTISESNPLRNSTAQEQFHARVEYASFDELLDAEQSYIHPSAKHFPGIPDKSTDKERDTIRTVTIPLKNNPENPVYEWESKSMGYSTKLYAPPGSILSLKLKREAGFKFQVRIGCHTDFLTHTNPWLRVPIIHMGKYFKGNSADVFSPFGGLIYIEYIKALERNVTITEFTFEITGAIPTPSFILDETSLIDWRERIRFIKAPFAEFESDVLRISVPYDFAKSIDNPEQTLIFWTNAINQMSDFHNIPRKNTFQSFAFDVDISFGYMHSGQPIMGRTETILDLFNNKYFCNSAIYLYIHEMGHNIQGDAWTLSDEGEVTNNLFTQYILNNFCHFPLEHTGHEGIELPDNNEKIKNYIERGGKYKEDFESLRKIFYYQIVKNFGWGVFRKSFKYYSNLSERPSNNDEEVDTRFVLYSIAANRNLAGLFKSWGLSISDGAISKVAHLPESELLMTDLLAKNESLA